MSDSNGGLSVNYGQVDFVCSHLQGIIDSLRAENKILQREIYRLSIPVFNPVTHYYETNDRLIASLRAELRENEAQIAILESLIQDLQDFKNNVKQTDEELAAIFTGICNNIIPRPIPGMPSADYVKYLNHSIKNDILLMTMITELSEINPSEKTSEDVKEIMDRYMMKKYAQKLYGISAEEANSLTHSNLTYFMFGEKHMGTTHRGIDINYYEKAPLHSIVSGKIISIRQGDSEDYSCVTIEIDDPFNPEKKINVMFLHLNISKNWTDAVELQYNIKKLESDEFYLLNPPIDIKAGDILGTEGTRGRGGYHTHIEFNSTRTAPQSATGPTPPGVLNADDYLAKIIVS